MFVGNWGALWRLVVTCSGITGTSGREVAVRQSGRREGLGVISGMMGASSTVSAVSLGRDS